MKSPIVATVSGHVFTYPTVTALNATPPLPRRPSAAVAPHLAFAFGFLPMDVLAMSLRHPTVVCGAAGVLLGAALVGFSGGVARGEERSVR
jgi:hypothetical protein